MTRGQEHPGDCGGSLQVIAKRWALGPLNPGHDPHELGRRFPVGLSDENTVRCHTATSLNPEKRTLSRLMWTSNKNYEITHVWFLILQLMVISYDSVENKYTEFWQVHTLQFKLPPR